MSGTAPPPAIVPVGDRAVLVDIAAEVTEATLARVHALDAALRSAPPVGVVELVPALTTLLAVFDPIVTDHRAVGEAVRAALAGTNGTQESIASTSIAPGRHHVIDVCYDAEHAPDLAVVAERTGLAPEAIVEAHLSGFYTVGMFGFAPGFAYLFGTPESIQLPRNPTPGDLVPDGSVIIAAQQCIVTPMAMTTGWFAIGRSAVQLLTDDAARPFLLDVCDTITFNRIGGDELRDGLRDRDALRSAGAA